MRQLVEALTAFNAARNADTKTYLFHKLDVDLCALYVHNRVKEWALYQFAKMEEKTEKEIICNLTY